MRITEMKPYIIIVGLVVAVAVAGRLAIAFADEAKPPQVEDASDGIYRNQLRRAEIRKYVEEDKLLEIDNAKQVGRLETFGWAYDFQQKKAVKLPLAQ